MRLLEENKICLDRIAETLLEKEVMQGEDLDNLLEEVLGKDGFPRSNRRSQVTPERPPLPGIQPGESEETSSPAA